MVKFYSIFLGRSPAPPTPPPCPPNCQFESGSCGWELYGLEFHWEVTNQANLSDSGADRPSGDHEGNFLYADADQVSISK